MDFNGTQAIKACVFFVFNNNLSHINYKIINIKNSATCYGTPNL